MAADAADERWMRLALSLGKRAQGQTWPNPAVGCVIVKEGRVLGRGWTKPGGRPHAETQALEQAGAGARGATAYVSLEPCAHRGKTPPCAKALISAGIARVVSAMEDPDTRVAGLGHDMLREAGIEVVTPCLADPAARDHRGFLLRTGENRPMVTLKLASSLDGRIATQSGESQWITSERARHYAHYLRATHDAVMVGSGTAIADDPRLTLRGLGTLHQPVRVICDTSLSTSSDGQLGHTAPYSPLWLCHGAKAAKARQKAWEDRSATLVRCNTDETGRLDLEDVLHRLAERGLTRIFCEGGGQIAASLLTEGLVDQLVIFTAGLALGATGTPSVATLPDQPLGAFERFTLSHTERIGPDTLSVWLKS